MVLSALGRKRQLVDPALKCILVVDGIELEMAVPGHLQAFEVPSAKSGQFYTGYYEDRAGEMPSNNTRMTASAACSALN